MEVNMIELIQSLYEAVGLNTSANLGDVFGILSTLFVTVAGFFHSSGQTSEQIEAPKEAEASIVEIAKKSELIETPIESVPAKENLDVKKATELTWQQRLRKGLSRSQSQVWGRLGSLFSGQGLTDEQLEEVEELLYGADIGPQIATELTDALVEKSKDSNFNEEAFKDFLFTFLKEKMGPAQSQIDEDLYNFEPTKHQGTKVIMIVGVNGAGKTTTIGKLATKLTAQGAKVVVGACDTFRAAAVDQLQVWCDRAGATMIRAKEGSNPSGVGYDALQNALSQKADYCLLDTAGRLHTKDNLMVELGKSKNVLKKLDEKAPDHVLLVIDAITGQNAIRQAEEFHKTLGLTGLIFTKCDGSSKAGSAVSIVQSLQVPITYIGVGESVDDLNNFNLDEYLNALLDK
jgi:fused signal recognition particle receptor